MITTIINVIFASILSVLAHYISNIWAAIFFGWIVGLLSLVMIVSLTIAGIVYLVKRRWVLGAINLVMLIPLIYYTISICQLIW